MRTVEMYTTGNGNKSIYFVLGVQQSTVNDLPMIYKSMKILVSLPSLRVRRKDHTKKELRGTVEDLQKYTELAELLFVCLV